MATIPAVVVVICFIPELNDTVGCYQAYAMYRFHSNEIINFTWNETIATNFYDSIMTEASKDGYWIVSALTCVNRYWISLHGPLMMV